MNSAILNGKPSFHRFVALWSGQYISAIGSGLTAFALGVHAFEVTQSATVYSLIILFGFLPSYVLKPIGGTLADRIDRRFLIAAGDFGSALCIGFILLMIKDGINNLWVIYSGVAASSIFNVFQNPAYKASVTDLADKRQFAKASGLMQLSESSRFLVSPVLAGFLLNITTIETVLIIDIGTFVAAILLLGISTIKTPLLPETKNQTFFKDFSSGFRYTFSKKHLVLLLGIISLLTFCVGFMQALVGPMILSFTNAKTLGTIQSISATGMIGSSLVIGLFSKSKNQVTTLTTALLLSGITYALFGTSTNINFLITTGFFFFATLPFINTTLEVMIRQNVENQVQGRVWSIVSLISQSGMVIAFALSGFLADQFFDPLLQEGGALASTAGKIVGIGPGRGIGFMFVLLGFTVTIFSFFIGKIKAIKVMATGEIEAAFAS